jgi:hypothetical protein
MIMNARLVATALASLTILAGCGDTDECKRLKELRGKYEKLLIEAKARSQLTPKLKERLDSAKQSTNRVLEGLGLDLAEERVAELVKERVQAIGATVVPKEVTGEADETGERNLRKVFEISFTEKDQAKVWANVEALAKTPPLLRVATLIKEKKGDQWTVQLEPIGVERADFEPRPVHLKALEKADTIAPELGFCGAGKMREMIIELGQQIDALRADAERTTVLLPQIATLDGLRHRAEAKKKSEDEALRIMRQLFEYVRASKTNLKAVGYEEPLVAVEVWGGPKERARLEEALAPMAEQLRPQESTPEVIRFGVFNALSTPRRPPPDPEHPHEIEESP